MKAKIAISRVIDDNYDYIMVQTDVNEAASRAREGAFLSRQSSPSVGEYDSAFFEHARELDGVDLCAAHEWAMTAAKAYAGSNPTGVDVVYIFKI